MFNPKSMMTMMSAWNTFQQNHPKFPAFLSAMKNVGIKEDTIIEISIIDPSGQKIETNIKVKQSDLELFDTLKDLS